MNAKGMKIFSFCLLFYPMNAKGIKNLRIFIILPDECNGNEKYLSEEYNGYKNIHNVGIFR